MLDESSSKASYEFGNFFEDEDDDALLLDSVEKYGILMREVTIPPTWWAT